MDKIDQNVGIVVVVIVGVVVEVDQENAGMTKLDNYEKFVIN